MSITSGIQGSAVTPVKINGVRKTLTNPITGFLLHQLAGFPNKLTGSGKTVEKTTEPIDVQPDMEFIADYGDGHGLDTPHAVEPAKPAEPPRPKPQPVTETPIVNTAPAATPAPAAPVAPVAPPPAAPTADKK